MECKKCEKSKLFKAVDHSLALYCFKYNTFLKVADSTNSAEIKFIKHEECREINAR